jgi:hypothetical protein
MYKLFLEQLNYRDRDPDHVDSRLLWMGIKDHLRDPKNFKSMMKRKTPYLWTDEIKSLDPKIKEKHPNLRVSFAHELEGYPRAQAAHMKEGNHHFIHLVKFNSLQPNMLQGNHLFDTHKSFMGELNRKFVDFTHEYKHYSDDTTKRIPYSIPDDQNNAKTYYNNPYEVSAHIHEKQYEIEKELLQNKHHPKNDGRPDNTLTHLPLRQRLYHYRENKFSEHLAIIQQHTGNNHHHWYNNLTPENQQKAKKSLQPIINKYMIPNTG